MKKKDFKCVFSSRVQGVFVCFKSTMVGNKVLRCDRDEENRDRCPYWCKK